MLGQNLWPLFSQTKPTYDPAAGSKQLGYQNNPEVFTACSFTDVHPFIVLPPEGFIVKLAAKALQEDPTKGWTHLCSNSLYLRKNSSGVQNMCENSFRLDILQLIFQV